MEYFYEESVVAQRIVYKSCGGVLLVDIDHSLLQYDRGSRACYQDALQRKRGTMAAENKKDQGRKKVADHIKILKTKKAKMLAVAAIEVSTIEVDIAKFEKLSM